MESFVPNIYPFDDRRDIALPGNEEQTIAFAVHHFLSLAKTAIHNKGAFFVALSGGSTPKKIYQQFLLPKNYDAIDWSLVHLFWSDERSVPPDHPDSNYKMAMDAAFSQLPIPKGQIHRMHAEKDIEKNALAYESLIKKIGYPLDLIMLGMGEDGHTASLFPHTKALTVNDHLVVANFVPSLNTHRMTFTFPLIHEAHATTIYVLGQNKQEQLKSVLLEKGSTAPIAKVGTKKHPSLWIIDDTASQLLLEQWKVG